MLFDFEGPNKDSLKSRDSRGGVAQLGEHLPCTQGVRSSILLISTKKSIIGVTLLTNRWNEEETTTWSLVLL